MPFIVETGDGSQLQLSQCGGQAPQTLCGFSDESEPPPS